MIGTEASIVVRDPWHCLAPGLGIARQDGPTEQLEFAPANPYKIEHVHAAVRGEPSPLLGRADALGQTRTIAALEAAFEFTNV